MSLSDITIIGGGAVGLFTAHALLAEGATVTLLEKGLLGQESSWAGGGILLPLYPWRQARAISELTLYSHRLYSPLAEQLLTDTGIDPEWTASGLLITQNPDVELAQAWCQHYQVPYSIVDSQALSQFQTHYESPLLLPSIAQARNPRLLKSLIHYLRQKGVNFIENAEVLAIEQQHQQVTALHTSQGKHAVKQVIITTGAWTGELFAQWGSAVMARPAVYPIKGQMLLFSAEPTLLPHIILDGEQYLIPRRDGHILAGSTVEQSGFEKKPSESARVQLTEFAYRLFPALAKYPLVKHWAGLRPATQQGIPYIDQHPDLHNLFINAGHFRNGLVLAPASAQLMVDILLQRPSAIDNTPYRFWAEH